VLRFVKVYLLKIKKVMSKSGFIEGLRENYNNIVLKEKSAILKYLYDFLVYVSGNYPHKFANRLIRKTCKRFKLKRKRVLDVGSFTGYHSFYFHCEGNHVTAVELSNKAEYARRRFRFYNIDFVQGDINDELLKFGNKFDFIFCSNLPLHYDTGSVLTSVSFNTFMERAVNCLNPGGTLYYIFYTSKHPKVAIPVDASELKMYCERSGLKNWSLENSQLLDNDTVELTVKNEV